MVLNKPDVPPDYYIVPGRDIRSDPAKFGKWFADLKDAGDSSERPRRVSQQLESFRFLIGTQAEPIELSNGSDLEAISVRVRGKKWSGLG